MIDTFSKHAWAVPLKDKNGVFFNAFQNILNNSKTKTKKIWVEKGREIGVKKQKVKKEMKKVFFYEKELQKTNQK